MVQALVIGVAAAGFAALAGGPVIATLRRFGVTKAISDEGPESHLSKTGTVTMGGVLMLATVLVFTLATNLAGNPEVLLPLVVMGAVGAVGVFDDLTTLQGRERAGAHERFGMAAKAALFFAVGLGAAAVLYFSLDKQDVLVPHYGRFELPSVLYIVIAAGVVSVTTSAAAVTDGLDGLLAGLMAICFVAYGVVSLMQGEDPLGVFCLTVAGAALGFLWHNAHPAAVFMGETGALPLGAGLAIVALMSEWWLLLLVIGVVLLAEGLSVALQIASFRLTGRRIFEMAPLHHHFELAGWAETQIAVRFWILGAGGTLLGLALALTE
jgi:phospho-N-acetylmuramoyl-pentapeptide-transferase